MTAEFTLSARAVYGGGARGEVLTAVSGASASECLAAIAPAIERWLSHARHEGNGRAPRELELRLGWRDPGHAPGRGHAPAPSSPPRGEARAGSNGAHAPRRRMECLSSPARARLGPGPAALAAALGGDR